MRAELLNFTTQDSNFVETRSEDGKITLKEVPTLHALPYGIPIGLDNAAYFCEFVSNKIGKIDPENAEHH